MKEKPVLWQWLDTVQVRRKVPDCFIKADWRPLYTKPQTKPLSDEEIKFILTVLEDSVDVVHQEYLDIEKLYKNVPTRKARVDGYKKAFNDHQKAIEMLEALKERHGIK